MKHLNSYKEEILNYGNILESKDIPNDINKYKIFVHDFQVINSLLNSLGMNKKYGMNYQNPFNSFNVKLNKDQFKEIIPINNLFTKNVPYTLTNPKIKQEDFKIIFISFLKDYDIQLYNIYANLVSQKSISFNNDASTGKGSIQHLILFDRFFVDIRNDNFKQFNLIHEIGHVKQIELCNKEINSLEKLYRSLFVEVYSKYLEIKFSEYLKQKGYMDFSLKWQEEFLIALSIYSERALSFYNINNELVINRSHFIINLIGYIYAILLKDKESEYLEKFNKIICSNDNFFAHEEINKIIGQNEIRYNINQFYNEYKQDFYKQKQLKKY